MHQSEKTPGNHSQAGFDAGQLNNQTPLGLFLVSGNSAKQATHTSAGWFVQYK